MYNIIRLYIILKSKNVQCVYDIIIILYKCQACTRTLLNIMSPFWKPTLFKIKLVKNKNCI